MFKRIICLFIFVILLISGCGKKQPVPEELSDLQTILNRGEIIVGVREDTKPFGYKDSDGNFQGFDIELAREIAKHILGDKDKVKFVTVTAADRIEKLNSKEVDILVATMTITSQRLRVIDFSQQYYTAGQALMVRAKSDITSLGQAVSYGRVIAVFGTTAEKSLRDAFPTADTHTAAKIIGARTYDEAFNFLKSGKGDALVADDSILMGFASSDKDVVLLPKRYSSEPYGVGFRQGKSSEDLQASVNELLEELTSNGRIRNLYK